MSSYHDEKTIEDSPCILCLVKTMCSKVCENLLEYVGDILMKHGIPDFSEGILLYDISNHLISNRALNKYKCMIVLDSVIGAPTYHCLIEIEKWSIIGIVLEKEVKNAYRKRLWRV